MYCLVTRCAVLEIQSDTMRDGDKITVTCDVVGYPDVMIMWMPDVGAVSITTTNLLDNAKELQGSLILSVQECLGTPRVTCNARNMDGNVGIAISKTIQLPCCEFGYLLLLLLLYKTCDNLFCFFSL